MAFDRLRELRVRNRAIYGTDLWDEMQRAQKRIRPSQACLLGALALGAITRPSLAHGPVWAEVVLFTLVAASLVFVIPYARAMGAVRRRVRERRLAWRRDHPDER